MAGQVIHFEIPADDVERAQKFYSEAFGWRMNTEPGHGYTLVGTTPSDPAGRPSEPGGINGGMLKRQQPIENVVITISVENMEAALKKVKKLGGSVIRESRPVGAVGFAAYIKDTEGNVMGLWQDAKA